jgi:hypothetical protein
MKKPEVGMNGYLMQGEARSANPNFEQKPWEIEW